MTKLPIEAPGLGALELDTASSGALQGAPLNSYVWQGAAASDGGPLRPYRDGIKRLLDVVLVLLSLPFALPLIGLCALALWREGGQPFYRQDRIGKNGKHFSLLKLRTMVPNAAEALTRHLAEDPAARDEWNRYQKLKDDPRITPLGHFLRATSIDELPQILNVLSGEMSLIGPRPMMPEQLEMYGDASAYCALRPGITGLWQVSARNTETFAYRNRVDATYEAELSAKLDAQILFRTVGVVLRQTGH